MSGCNAHHAEVQCLEHHCGWCLPTQKCDVYFPCDDKLAGCTNFTVSDYHRDAECDSENDISMSMILALVFATLAALFAIAYVACVWRRRHGRLRRREIQLESDAVSSEEQEEEEEEEAFDVRVELDA